MSVSLLDIFPWLERWGLIPDGAAFETESAHSHVLPVLRGHQRLMLKLSSAPEEINSGALMAWWDGDGAAKVFAHEGPALLLERATSPDGLGTMAQGGHDIEALALLCKAVATLHRPRDQPPPPELVPLKAWFRNLDAVAGLDERLARAGKIAQELLAEPRDATVLHGDIHHANVLDFGSRGWLAIDPKGVFGERAYDYANIFQNPDGDTALAEGRMGLRLEYICGHAGLEPDRMMRWIAAHAGLSAVWSIEDGQDPWSLKVLDAVLGQISQL